MSNNIILGTRMQVEDMINTVRKDKSIDEITITFYHPEDNSPLWMYRFYTDGYECIGCNDVYSNDYQYKSRYFTTKDKEILGSLSPYDYKQIRNKAWQHTEHIEFIEDKRKAGILRRINGKGVCKLMKRLCNQKGYAVCKVLSISYKTTVTQIPPDERPQITLHRVVRNRVA